MRERDITTIDDKLYNHLAGKQGSVLSFSEFRSDSFWQELNDKIFKDLSDFITLKFCRKIWRRFFVFGFYAPFKKLGDKYLLEYKSQYPSANG